MSTRRTFLKQAGCISIGFSLLGPFSCISEGKGSVMPYSNKEIDPEQIDAWLELLADGRLKVITGKMELGQGISIAVMQVAAEELQVEIDRVSIHLAETGVTPDEGITAGSRSIETSAMNVRRAAACAREVLISMAAEKTGLPVSEMRLENGKIKAGNDEFDWTEIIEGEQISKQVYEPEEIYAKTRRKLVGTPVPRPDLEKMIRGEEFYVQDLRFPGMLHARVVRPPSYKSGLKALEEQNLANTSGFVKLVRKGSFLAVIAEKEYQAIKFQEEINKRCEWESKPIPSTPEELKSYLKSLPANSAIDEERGDWSSASGGKVVKASYSKPYIMHAANGPSCAIAIYENEVLQIWCHSQGVYPLRDTIANMLDLPKEQVYIKGVPGSGCYGHNAADDVAAEAALLAKEIPGRHIRLQWMREEEHAWEPYGSAMIMEHEASLDEKGQIQTWSYELWSDGHSTRPTSGDPANLLPGRYLEKGFGVPGPGWRGGAIRNAPPIYKTGAFKLTSNIFEGPLRISALRGLGAYANVFGIECFMDELAEKAGKDPFEFRLAHLEDERAIDCLKKLKDMTSGVQAETGQGFGIGFAQYKNSASYCAVAALVETSEEETKWAVVKKMWGVIDSGECINPDGLKNQTEGGMIQSASWTLLEQVKWDANGITSLDWETYPMLRFEEIPVVEVEVIDRPEMPPLGAGEAAQGPSAAAVVNAISAATGNRLRDLPVNR
ncbi:molybdopterin-dependent oxidoreductase [Gramella sp. GC03-9]|uniref:Molybdopterin-dependent oxidoreductase n=1 Tax=Christiangramia oceanisediminis TaxID=2920386 RepID=A0A9X2KVB0_9FLAO|nr:molybdopterin cofactor-binding domain-containing protein [Gramella oceanisediminis]MCP9198495.1 molybdopterin-dependent oxidoreductase [Gramella oceanisediminis]